MNNDSCGPSRSCAWRAATRLRTSPAKLCMAMTRSGDPCGARAVGVVQQEDWETSPMLALCESHWSTLRDFVLVLHYRSLDKRKRRILAKNASTKNPRPQYPLSRVYFAQRGDIVKIGVSIQVEERIANLVSMAGLPFDRVVTTPGTEELEQRYHDRFAAYRQIGEWFTAHPVILAEMERLAS